MKRTIASLLALTCVGLFAVTGCKKDEKKGDKDKPAATASTDTPKKPDTPPDTPPEPAEPEELTADEAIPTEADFEEEAETELTADNLEAELAKLEDEFAGEDE